MHHRGVQKNGTPPVFLMFFGEKIVGNLVYTAPRQNYREITHPGFHPPKKNSISKGKIFSYVLEIHVKIHPVVLLSHRNRKNGITRVAKHGL